jgi:hypothetical protein
MPGVLSKEKVTSWISSHSAKRTKSTYKSPANQLIAFCKEANVPTVPATEETVSSFLIDKFEKGKARSTINNVAYSAVLDLNRYEDIHSKLSSSNLIKSTKRSTTLHTPAPKKKKPCLNY